MSINNNNNKTKSYRRLRFLGIVIILSTIIFSFSSRKIGLNSSREDLLKSSKELRKVVKHYSEKGDSLQLQAAYFLIDNIKDKSFVEYNKGQEKFLNYLDSLESAVSTPRGEELKHRYKVYDVWKKIKEENKSFFDFLQDRTKDIEVITSEMLIENIDYAFKVWEEDYWGYDLDFDEFCEYILPYRASSGKPSQWRKIVYENNKWAYDNQSCKDLMEFSEAMIDGQRWFNWNKAFYDFQNMPVTDLLKTKRGQCIHHSNLRVAALRSIGIPASQVFGINHTTWITIPNGNGGYIDWGYEMFSDVDHQSMGERRKEEYAKVYEKSFKIQPNPLLNLDAKDVPKFFLQNNIKDVTAKHIKAVDIAITLKIAAKEQTNYAYLCVYNNKVKGWDAVDWAKIDKEQVIFEQMGVGRIYLAMYYEAGKYYPASTPFFVDMNGERHSLEADNSKKEIVKIYRKNMLNFNEHIHAELMVNTVFEGSNDQEFKVVDTIYQINDKPFKNESRLTNNNKKYRYVRYKAGNVNYKVTRGYEVEKIYNDYGFIADVSFYDGKGNKLKGQFISSTNVEEEKGLLALDGDIRTNLNCDTNCWIGYDLKEPQEVASVKYLFRNSFNAIEAEDIYELFYWDNEWKSLGEKKAKEDYIEYNIPKNSVLWLRNRTKGNDEKTFFMSEGKQIWG